MSDDDLPDDSKPTRTKERWAALGKFLQAGLTVLLFGISPALAQDAGTPSADNSPPSLDDAQKVFTAAFEQTCGLDGGDDTLDPPQMFDLDFNYSYDEAGTPPHPLRLFRFFCGMGAYNVLSVYMAWTETDGLQALSFPAPHLDVEYEDETDVIDSPLKSIAITGMDSTQQLVNSEFDEKTRTISAVNLWRGIGDAAESATYVLEEGRFVLKTYDVDASYDGEINPVRVLDYSKPQPVELKVIDDQPADAGKASP
jgi:hypothetical protein